MIDTIQGPPRWDGPDVLLRQTSFRALAEPRRFRDRDGEVVDGSLRVRFGEVEARGVALTPAGRDRYDELLAEVDRRLATGGLDGAGSRAEVAARVWRERLPDNEADLDGAGLGFFAYRLTGAKPPTAVDRTLDQLIAAGTVVADPIVYEDFLPRSAAGIFQSNLAGTGTRNTDVTGDDRDLEWMSEMLGREVADPMALYAAERAGSLRVVASGLGVDPALLDRRPT